MSKKFYVTFGDGECERAITPLCDTEEEAVEKAYKVTKTLIANKKEFCKKLREDSFTTDTKDNEYYLFGADVHFIPNIYYISEVDKDNINESIAAQFPIKIESNRETKFVMCTYDSKHNINIMSLFCDTVPECLKDFVESHYMVLIPSIIEDVVGNWRTVINNKVYFIVQLNIYA